MTRERKKIWISLQGSAAQRNLAEWKQSTLFCYLTLGTESECRELWRANRRLFVSKLVMLNSFKEIKLWIRQLYLSSYEIQVFYVITFCI